MDAHFYKSLALELENKLKGRRVEKIFSPADGVWTFAIQAKGGKDFLLFRPAKSVSLLFLSKTKPQNPMAPPASIMWLRKRLANRRIFDAIHDWINLRSIFTLSPYIEKDKYKYLLLDMKKGVSLLHEIPDNFSTQICWPCLDQISTEKEIWKEFPQITPPLRKKFSISSEEESNSLLLNLSLGVPDKFYVDHKNGLPQAPRAWSMNSKDEIIFDSAIEAACHYGERILFPTLQDLENSENNFLIKSKKKKYKKVLKRIEMEESRLNSLLERKIEGEALQAEMYRIKDLRELDKITVNHPEHGEMEVELDPRLTPTENMQKIFKFAGKAGRGLEHMKRRRLEVEKEFDEFMQTTLLPRQKENRKKEVEIPNKYKGLAVNLFVSSDGFLMIRGKNSKANHEILSKTASAFDYWFHVHGGPGSHVILKRDHPSQEIPEQTIIEAATLASLKSYRANDSKAEVMCALVKNVRKVKGFALGQVAVDMVEQTVQVTVDHDLEQKIMKK